MEDINKDIPQIDIPDREVPQENSSSSPGLEELADKAQEPQIERNKTQEMLENRSGLAGRGTGEVDAASFVERNKNRIAGDDVDAASENSGYDFYEGSSRGLDFSKGVNIKAEITGKAPDDMDFSDFDNFKGDIEKDNISVDKSEQPQDGGTSPQSQTKAKNTSEVQSPSSGIPQELLDKMVANRQAVPVESSKTSPSPAGDSEAMKEALAQNLKDRQGEPGTDTSPDSNKDSKEEALQSAAKKAMYDAKQKGNQQEPKQPLVPGFSNNLQDEKTSGAMLRPGAANGKPGEVVNEDRSRIPSTDVPATDATPSKPKDEEEHVNGTPSENDTQDSDVENESAAEDSPEDGISESKDGDTAPKSDKEPNVAHKAADASDNVANVAGGVANASKAVGKAAGLAKKIPVIGAGAAAVEAGAKALEKGATAAQNAAKTASTAAETAGNAADQVGGGESTGTGAPDRSGANRGGLAGGLNPDDDEKEKKQKKKDKAKKRKMRIFLLTKVLPIVAAVLMMLLLFASCSSMLMGSLGGSDSSNTIESEKGGFIPSVNVNAAKPDGSDSNSTSSTPLGDWVYYDQINPNWEGWDKTSFKSSCGQVAMAMVCATYGGDDKKYTPNWLRTTKMKYGNEGLNQPGCVEYLNEHQDEFHLKASSGHWCSDEKSWDKMKSICDAGGCIVLYQVYYSAGGMHWVVVRSIDGDDVVVANPNGGKEETFSKANIISRGCPNGSGGAADAIFCEKI